MSDNGDFWKMLHEKRTGVSKSKKPEVLPRRTSKNAPKSAPARRLPSVPKPFASDPFATRANLSDQPVQKRRVQGGARSSKSRFTVTIDMVSPENREQIRYAAKSEGRSLSQWARRILLSASDSESKEK